MKRPTVSVLIPTYNYARFLPEAIESVLQQDFTDFELIISDDASSDNTVEVCQKYAERDPRIRFVRQEKNLGLAGNFNWCLQTARGEFIKFLMADDRLERPYALTKLVEAIRKPGISLAGSARNLMDESSAVTGTWNPLGSMDSLLCGEEIILRCLKNDLNMIGEPSAVLFKAADAKRGFRPDYRQLIDLEMWFHLLRCGGLAYIAEPLCGFRRHSAQETENNRKTGSHWYEMVELSRSYLNAFSAKIALFRQLRSIEKRRPDLADLVEKLRANFSPAEYLFFLIRFKFLRCFIRLHRSLNKAVSGKTGGCE